MDADPAVMTPRDKLAFKIVCLANIILVLVAIAAIYFAGDRGAVTSNIFNGFLPLLGTWVGTVIAFYFQKENMDSAAKNTRELLAQVGAGGANGKIKAAEAKGFLRREQIQGVVIPAGQDEKAVTVAALKDFLDKNPNATRIPVFTADNLIKYVVHKSIFWEFYAGANAPAGTLLNLVQSSVAKDYVTKIAFVGPEATLADAQAAMQGMDNSQDVFMTKTGKADGVVLGWLMNVDIARELKAN